MQRRNGRNPRRSYLEPKKDAPGWAVVVMLVVFLVWGYIYLVDLRPLLNAWLAQYISGYPAMLHLFPILAVPILVLLLLTAIFGKVAPTKSGSSSPREGLNKSPGKI